MILTPQQTRSLIEDAAVEGYAVLAVNADSPAAVLDCLVAASSCDAPLLIEASLWQLTGHSFGAGDPILGIDRYILRIGPVCPPRGRAHPDAGCRGQGRHRLRAEVMGGAGSVTR